MDGSDNLPLSSIDTGNFICNECSNSLSRMGRKNRHTLTVSQKEQNKASFVAIENEWKTVRIGYIRNLSGEAKAEIERIYREELDQTWLPNRYCSGCYFKAVEELIYHFNL